MTLTLDYIKSLPVEQRKIAVIHEKMKCEDDPYYTIVNYFEVLDPTQGKQVKFNLYPYQKRAVADFESYDYTLTMKTRQTGLTTISAAYVAWFMATHENMVVSALAQEKKTSKRFLKQVRMFLDNARLKAPWLIPNYQKGNDAKESFGLTNGSTILAEANKPDACRGDVINLLVIDEVAAITWMEDIWASAGLTLTRSQGKCIGISCVTKDTYVFTDKGIQQIEDFIPINIDHAKKETYKIPQYNLKGKDEKRLGDSFHVNGYGKTRKIITPYAELEGSIEHKFWTYKEGKYDWVRCEDLKIGDWVNTQYGMNCWGDNDDISDFNPHTTPLHKNRFKPSVLTPDICYFLGLYISEGCANTNNVYITCGDNISPIFEKLGLSYYQQEGNKIKYEISSLNLVAFLKYLGFDITKKAHSKEIPKRLMSISKENMKALLQGIFDGDGYSTIKKNRVGINLKSKKLIEQIRIILGNFGILSTYSTVSKEQLNSYYSKKGIIHRYDSHCLEINSHFATVYHKEIGFRIERKIQTSKTNKYNLSSIPNGDEIARKLCKIGKTSLDTIRTKHKIYIHYNENPGLEKLNKLYNHILKQNPELIDNKELKEIKDKVLIDNSMWVQITNIEEKEDYTYDFDLPENKDDFWDKSAIYNGLLIYDTPKGQTGWYFDQYTNAEEFNWKIIDAHWSEHPIFNKGTYQWIKNDSLEGGYLKMFNNEWPEQIAVKKSVKKIEPKETYKFILDGKLRSPWYDSESKRLGKNKTRCELDCSFAGTGGEVLDPEIVRGIMLRQQEYKAYNSPLKGIWQSYKEYISYNSLHEYIISCDCMTGDGSDWSAFVVIDINTREVCATFKEQLDPKAYARIIAEVGMKYGMALAIVENQQGLTTLYELKDTCGYRNIYYTTLKQKDIDKKERRKKLGFWQSEETRTLGGDKLEEYLISGELVVTCPNIVNELHTWVWDKTGRRNHSTGKHDDLCVKKGTFIKTNKGLKKIEDIIIGDEVLTHLGRYKKVTKTFRNKTNKLCEINSLGKLPLHVTENHPLYVHNLNSKKDSNGNKYIKFEYNLPKWESIEDMGNEILKKNLCNVVDKKIESIKYIDLLKYCPSTYREVNGKLIGYTYEGTRKNNKSNPLNRFLEITPELCWIMGYFLAEGSCGQGNVSWATNQKEIGFRNKTKNYFLNLGLKPYETKYETKCITISVANKVLRNFFHTIGKGENKKLPEEFLFLSPCFQKEIICGYLAGDGHFSKNGISAFSISANISLILHQFLLRCGVNSRIKEDIRNVKTGNKSGFYLSLNQEESKKVIEWITDISMYKQKIYHEFKETKQTHMSRIKFDESKNYICSPITSIKKYNYSEYVYNIEVEDDNSYVANEIVVHNCMALTMGMFFIHYVAVRRQKGNEMMRKHFEYERKTTVINSDNMFDDIFDDLLKNSKEPYDLDRLSSGQDASKNNRRVQGVIVQ